MCVILRLAGFKKQRWVKVDERATLHSVLAQSDHIVPGVPGLFLHPFKYRVHPVGKAFQFVYSSSYPFCFQ